MSKIILVSALVLAASLLWALQARRITEVRGEIRELEQRLPAEGEQVSRLPPPRPPVPAASKSARTEPEGSKAAGASPEHGRPARAGVAPMEADRLKAAGLMAELGLAPGEDLELNRQLTDYAAGERVAATHLLECSLGVLSGSEGYAALAAAMRDLNGVANGGPAKAIRSGLDADQLRSFEAYRKESLRNVLQLLADQEFEAWQRHLDFEDKEVAQAAYDIFYRSWERQMASPLPDGFGAAALREALQSERQTTLSRFTPLLPAEQVEVMRRVLEMGHGRLVEQHAAETP